MTATPIGRVRNRLAGPDIEMAADAPRFEAGSVLADAGLIRAPDRSPDRSPSDRGLTRFPDRSPRGRGLTAVGRLRGAT